MKKTAQLKSELDTPCLVLDLDVLERNLLKMQAIAGKAGKRLRPHAKTHKCSALARRQIEAGAIGVCVAKVSEAEALAKAGIAGILITGPVATPQKIRRLVEVLAKTPSLMVTVDHPAGVDMLSAALREAGLKMDVLLDIDVGLHRTGVAPTSAPGLVDHILSKPNLRLRGIQAYAGQVQHLRSYADRKHKSLACLEKAARVFRDLRARVKSCTVFSASGTGTHDIDLLVPEVTELQVGSYACMDAEYMAIGSAGDSKQFTAFGPALRLLTTVVSVNRKGFVTVDAGLKSLYRDGPAPRIITLLRQEPPLQAMERILRRQSGYGGQDDALGFGGFRKDAPRLSPSLKKLWRTGGAGSFTPGCEGMRYDWFGDEYGKITCAGRRRPALGDVLELIPSHCDPTVNLFDRFFLTKGVRVVGEWAIDLRGCSQ